LPTGTDRDKRVSSFPPVQTGFDAYPPTLLTNEHSVVVGGGELGYRNEE
jgi:hypothetical protein